MSKKSRRQNTQTQKIDEMRSKKRYFRAGKRSKFNNVFTTYDGRTYHSRAEAQFAAQLDDLKQAIDPSEKVLKWIPQYKLSLELADTHICNYAIDFKVWYADGRVELIEVKGAETPLWRLKWKMSIALNAAGILEPDCVFKLVKV